MATANLLTTDELQHLQSLNESELSEFLESLPLGELDSVIEQLQGTGQQQSGAELAGNYANERSRKNAEAINAKTAAAQEIGPLPEVANPDRRKRCSESLLAFAREYFAPTFYLPFAPYQIAMLECFERVIQHGGKEVHAVRRGGLKSTCARVACLWAAVCGHRKFPVLVGATDDKANEHRENFFAMLAASGALLEDFPELLPLLIKWRQPKRQFRLGGRLLAVHPKDERGRIVFPDIHDAVSCQTHVAPYSVAASDVSGLSYVDRFGVTIRPDLLIFDDVQTPQSARSPLQTQTIEDAVTKTFCGLVGLGQKLAAIMVCTVREQGDLTERFLDRKIHPDWSGSKYPSLLRMPERVDLWDRYSAKLTASDTPEEGKRQAQAYYADNREAMDEGGKVAWECDKLPDEISALQSLLTIRALTPEFFRCEIQQEGQQRVQSASIRLSPQELLPRLSQIPRGVVPRQASYVTAFVDSSDQVLWWMVCAFAADFSGWIVDYGTWPDQQRAVFYKSDLAHRISEQMPTASWEEAFVHAHNELDRTLLAEWITDDGNARQVDLILKDWSDGQQKPRIESQVLANPFRQRIRPSKGFGPKPGRKPVHLWGSDKDRHAGTYWVERRSDNPPHVQYDVNIWKSHAARRLLTTMGAPSSVLLPGSNEAANKLLAEHLTAEQPKEIVYDGAAGIQWELTPTRNNDWWDCFVGCHVAASMLGCTLGGERPAAQQAQRRTFSLPGVSRGR
jgi:hypothetical protein